MIKIFPLLLLSAGLSDSFSIYRFNPLHNIATIKPKSKPVTLHSNLPRLKQLEATKERDYEFDKLDGDHGKNPYFERYLNDARANEQGIASRGKISAYLYNKEFSQIDLLKSFFTSLQIEEELIYPNIDQQKLEKQIFCLIMSYLAAGELYHQLVFSPLMSALKKSGYLESKDLNEVKNVVALFTEKYSAQQAKKMLVENSESLETHFNQLILESMQDHNFILSLAKAKEAITMVTFLSSLERPKENEEVDHQHILMKMTKVAEGLGLGAAEELLYSKSEGGRISFLARAYRKAGHLFEELDNSSKRKYFKNFLNWSEQLQKNSSREETKTTDFWHTQIEKQLAYAKFVRIAEQAEFAIDQLKNYDADRKIVVIYRSKNTNQKSYDGLKNLALLTLPRQKIISIDNPKDLAKAIMKFRYEKGYLLIPDGDLDSYYQDINDLKPSIDDAIRNYHWDILGIGAGGVILADKIIEYQGNARLIKKGIGLIPGEGGETFIPCGKLNVIDLPHQARQALELKNKGRYIKADDDSADNTEKIGKYSMDEELGSSILAYNLEGSTVYFSALPIESFLESNKDPDQDLTKSLDAKKIGQSLAIWYRFLGLTKAKKIN